MGYKGAIQTKAGSIGNSVKSKFRRSADRINLESFKGSSCVNQRQEQVHHFSSILEPTSILPLHAISWLKYVISSIADFFRPFSAIALASFQLIISSESVLLYPYLLISFIACYEVGRSAQKRILPFWDIGRK